MPRLQYRAFPKDRSVERNRTFSGGRAAIRSIAGQFVSRIRHKLSSLLVESLNDVLNGVHFAFLEVCLATLVTDLGRDCIEYQVIAVAVDMERCLRALHLPLTIDPVHMLFVRIDDEYSTIRRLLASPALSDTGRPDLFGDFRTAIAFDQGNVVLALEVEPETGTVAEVAAKPNSGLGGD